MILHQIRDRTWNEWEQSEHEPSASMFDALAGTVRELGTKMMYCLCGPPNTSVLTTQIETRSDYGET